MQFILAAGALVSPVGGHVRKMYNRQAYLFTSSNRHINAPAMDFLILQILACNNNLHLSIIVLSYLASSDSLLGCWL